MLVKSVEEYKGMEIESYGLFLSFLSYCEN